MDVILSIKPEYVNLILTRQKVWEFRKKIFKKSPIGRIHIYSSSPVKRIVANFKPGMIYDGTACNLYDILKTEGIGITQKDLFGYFGGSSKTGYAIEITDLDILTEPVDPVTIIPGFKPPQSYRYWR